MYNVYLNPIYTFVEGFQDIRGISLQSIEIYLEKNIQNRVGIISVVL